MDGYGIVIGIGVLALVLGVFWLYFHRQPRRAVPRTGIVSPADGKIVRVIPFSGKGVRVPKGLLGQTRPVTRDVARKGSIVVIMLTPLDVHFQRAPADGVVERIRYVPGRFRNVVSTDASQGAFENERNEILIRTRTGRLKVVQVAGFLARRIRCFVKKGDRVTRGQVIGLITFGSQVLLVLPAKRLRVTAGQRVTDGETVIA